MVDAMIVMEMLILVIVCKLEEEEMLTYITVTEAELEL